MGDHRQLLEKRWEQLNEFASENVSSNKSSKLSPESAQLKKDIFSKEGPLKDSSIKGYKKKLTAYVQGLSNASDRLNSVHREEAGHFVLLISV